MFYRVVPRLVILESMGLYETLSERYDEIFPVNPATVDYVRARMPAGARRRILDLGSATGGHALAFAAQGVEVLGIELSAAMTLRAEAAANRLNIGPRPRFFPGDMRHAARFAAEAFGPEPRFGAALCLGNTLPHLAGDTLTEFFAAIRALLSPGCPFVLQTLNYAHPEAGPGFRFPDIELPGLRFSRRYTGAERGDLRFETRIETAQGNFEDAILLHPHLPENMAKALLQAGFERIEACSGWDGSAFSQKRDRYLIMTGFAPA
ncbi:MAG: class I SAM-dependent methyltransferase [Rectinema sp.]